MSIDAIDISHWQPDFSVDVLRSWAALGVSRVIVKLGGANNGLYISRDHAAKTAAAHAAGMTVEHYWFNGRDATLAEQARVIAAAIPAGERLWWDVENEGGMRWTPAEVAEASRLLTVQGHPRQGVYMSEAVTREADWSAVAGLPLWVAAYRRNDGAIPQDIPTPAHWAGFALWQYTDRGQLPGYLGDLDLNTTRGGIPTTRGGIPEGSIMTPEQYAYWANFWGNPGRRHNPYGSPGDKGLYAKGYHRGEDIATGGDVANVPALPGGTIVAAGRSRLIGFFVAIVYDLWPTVVFVHCHLFEGTARTGGRVQAGEVFARTAGMGESPGAIDGPHLHLVATTHSDGGYNTDRPDFDPKPYIEQALTTLEDDMFTNEDRARLDATYAGVFGARSLGPASDKLTWTNADGTDQASQYGLLPIVIYNQALIADLAGKIAGVTKAVEQLAKTGGGSVDPGIIEEAASKGAADALGGLAQAVRDKLAEQPLR